MKRRCPLAREQCEWVVTVSEFWLTQQVSGHSRCSAYINPAQFYDAAHRSRVDQQIAVTRDNDGFKLYYYYYSVTQPSTTAQLLQFQSPLPISSYSYRYNSLAIVYYSCCPPATTTSTTTTTVKLPSTTTVVARLQQPLLQQLQQSSHR
jgi:hypothetical protein